MPISSSGKIFPDFKTITEVLRLHVQEESSSALVTTTTEAAS